MKKAFLVLTAVLLAVLMVGCNDFTPGVSGGSGNRVKIAIEQDSGSARSLLQPVAESDMDYIEVIFARRTAATGTEVALPLVAADNEIYREAWMLNNIGTIGIPDGFDVNDPKCLAVVFGGLKDGKILLAVGKISKVNSTAYVSGTATPIKNGDTVTFKMVALTSAVTDDNTSKFKITATGTTTTATDPDYIPTTALTTPKLPTLKFRNTKIPVYRVANSTEAGSTAITATYEFGFSEKNPTAGSPPVAVTTFSDYGKYIIRKQDAPSIRTMGTTLENGYTKAALNVIITTTFANDDVLPQTIAFTITTQDSGLCTIFFRIPVYMCGIDTSVTPYGETVRHTKWYVQSGLDNSVLDTGSLDRSGEPVAANATGGSILLGIGKDYDYKEKDRAEVEVGW